MKVRLFRMPGAFLLLVPLLFAGCVDEEFTISNSVYSPNFSESWVAVHGTVSHPGWSAGRFVFTVYPQGAPPTPGAGQRGGSIGGAAFTSYVAGVPVNSGNVYILAFNDVDGSQTPGATEWQACSGILSIGTDDVYGVDLVLASPPPVCP